MNKMLRKYRFTAVAVSVVTLLSSAPTLAQTNHRNKVRDRLWIWGHPAGVYNESFLAGLSKKSTVDPVSAAEYMGIRNMIFVRYDGKPQPPFGQYYQPFRKLDRVYWSLVGASGVTSGPEREQVYELAKANNNIVGFILDDFFHASATDAESKEGIWLAHNKVQFPVTVTVKPPQAIRCDELKLVQSDWRTGDYRTKDFVIELSTDGKEFRQVIRSTLSNAAAAKIRVKLPGQKCAALRIRILNTHDTKGAISCGLKAMGLYAGGLPIDMKKWRAVASSSYPGFDAATLLGSEVPFPASLTPQQLHALGQQKVRGKNLPIMAVVYTGQISPRAQAHLHQVDQVCLWTWRPDDLKDLEANLTKLEQLVGNKPIFLGCYMYDFASRRRLSVELMQRQTEAGYQWLKEGRIQGMIFLATPNVDVDLKAVEWTREWISQVGDEPLADQ